MPKFLRILPIINDYFTGPLIFHGNLGKANIIHLLLCRELNLLLIIKNYSNQNLYFFPLCLSNYILFQNPFSYQTCNYFIALPWNYAAHGLLNYWIAIRIARLWNSHSSSSSKTVHVTLFLSNLMFKLPSY